MKRMTFAAALFISLVLAGCAHVAYEGPPRPSSELSTINTSGTQIQSIDGREVSRAGGNYASYVVLAGERTVTVILNDVYLGGSRTSRSALTVRVRTEPGHSYTVKPEYEGAKWRPVILDNESGQVVSYQ